MKCKNCTHFNGDLKGICNNPKSENYNDFVYKKMECAYGVSKNDEPLDYWKFAEKENKKAEIVNKFVNGEIKVLKGQKAIIRTWTQEANNQKDDIPACAYFLDSLLDKPI